MENKKFCKGTCKQEKFLNEFSKNFKTKDKLQYKCRACLNKDQQIMRNNKTLEQKEKESIQAKKRYRDKFPKIEKKQLIDNLIFCKKCKEYKDKNLFYCYNDKIQRPCKKCKELYRLQYKEERKVWASNFRKINKNNIKVYKKKYYSILENKINKNKQDKIWRQNNKERKKENDHNYHQNNRLKRKEKDIKNREIIRLKERERLVNDPAFSLRKSISQIINQELKKNNSSKNGHSIIKYMPFTMKELKTYIEYLFEDWMTWDKKGAYFVNAWDDNDPKTWRWQLDHIVPQSHLTYTSMEDENFKKCWALENLRPLSAKQNLLDGNSRTTEEIVEIKLFIQKKLKTALGLQ